MIFRGARRELPAGVVVIRHVQDAHLADVIRPELLDGGHVRPLHHGHHVRPGQLPGREPAHRRPSRSHRARGVTLVRSRQLPEDDLPPRDSRATLPVQTNRTFTAGTPTPSPGEGEDLRDARVAHQRPEWSVPCQSNRAWARTTDMTPSRSARSIRSSRSRPVSRAANLRKRMPVRSSAPSSLRHISPYEPRDAAEKSERSKASEHRRGRPARAEEAVVDPAARRRLDQTPPRRRPRGRDHRTRESGPSGRSRVMIGPGGPTSWPRTRRLSTSRLRAARGRAEVMTPTLARSSPPRSKGTSHPKPGATTSGAQKTSSAPAERTARLGLRAHHEQGRQAPAQATLEPVARAAREHADRRSLDARAARRLDVDRDAARCERQETTRAPRHELGARAHRLVAQGAVQDASDRSRRPRPTAPRRAASVPPANGTVRPGARPAAPCAAHSGRRNASAPTIPVQWTGSPIRACSSRTRTAVLAPRAAPRSESRGAAADHQHVGGQRHTLRPRCSHRPRNVIQNERRDEPHVEPEAPPTLCTAWSCTGTSAGAGRRGRRRSGRPRSAPAAPRDAAVTGNGLETRSIRRRRGAWISPGGRRAAPRSSCRRGRCSRAGAAHPWPSREGCVRCASRAGRSSRLPRAEEAVGVRHHRPELQDAELPAAAAHAPVPEEHGDRRPPASPRSRSRPRAAAEASRPVPGQHDVQRALGAGAAAAPGRAS